MDGNFSYLPLGPGMALARTENVRTGYDGLSETEKEHIILKCKDAKSREEMEKIVNSYAGEDAGDLMKDAGIR